MRHVLYRVDTNGNLLLKWKSCSSSISSTSLSPFPLPSLLRGVQASQNNEVPSWRLVTLLSPTVPRAFLPVPPPSLQPSSAQASSLCLLCWCVTAPALLTQTATGTWDRQPAGPAPALPQVLLGLGGSGDPPHRAWGCRILCGFWLVFLFPTSCRHLSGGAFGGCHCDPHVQQWPCTALYCTQPHVGTGHTDPRRETIPLLPTQHKITFWLCFREYYSCAAKLFFNGIFK